MKNLNIFDAPVRPDKDNDHLGPASFRHISACNEWFASDGKKTMIAVKARQSWTITNPLPDCKISV
jgi:hypothetical protein